ncbi:hypothetical protein D3C86_1788630 [compost metagenome]
MAEYARSQSQQIHQQERAEGRGLRQQEIKHGRGGGYVQRGDEQLQERQAASWQAQGATTDLDQQVIGVRLFRQAATV